MIDSSDVRKINKDKIRRVMWQGGEFTKQGVAVKTGLSVATCNTLLNDMNRYGEVISEKKRFQEVGRSTVAYQINESYESILCVSFRMLKGKKSLDSTVLSPLGTVLKHTENFYDTLDYSVVAENVSFALSMYSNISRIMIGTPSIAEHGIIRHCDIPELENEPIVKKTESQFSLPVCLENDMHFMVYGYYKKQGTSDDVLTLANFPSHILPGTATIHEGTIIKGKNRFAGMVGFLPYDVSREEQLRLLEQKTCLPLVSKAVSSIIAIVNPNVIVFTGDLLNAEILERVRKECLKTIPEEYMPNFSFSENTDSYYLEGMYQKALDLKGRINND